MPSYVALLRAVNIAPRWLKMADLRDHLTALGYGAVETYIQSGNVRLDSRARSAERVAAQLTAQISAYAGFAVPALVRTTTGLRQVANTAASLPTPFPDADPAVVRRYVTFLERPLESAAAQTLDEWDVPGERVAVVGAEIHWWLTKSTHQAKLSNARIERHGTATTRDLKVVTALAQRWGA